MSALPPRPPVVDAHAHLFDFRANRYPVFEHRDQGFEALQPERLAGSEQLPDLAVTMVRKPPQPQQ